MSDYHVIGIDPSLSGTGLAYDNGITALVKTQTSQGDQRLQVIFDKVYEAAGSGHWKHTPTLAVIEDLPVNAMSAGKTGQAQGVTRLALCMAGVSILSIPPATLKKYATGKGNAKKHEMIAAWNEYAHANEKDDNRVDAAWLRDIGRTLMSFAEDTPKSMLGKRSDRGTNLNSYLETARAVRRGYVIQ